MYAQTYSLDKEIVNAKSIHGLLVDSIYISIKMIVLDNS